MLRGMAKDNLVLPLSIYVVFHTKSAEATFIADELHDWFRLKQDDGDTTEAGLPIWFRSHVEAGEVSPRIQWQEAEVNAVVILADDHLVADPAWRAAVELLCDDDDAKARIYPVPLARSGFRLASLFQTRNQLSAGAPAPESAEEASRRSHWDRRARALRRSLTEAITRELRRKPNSGADDAPDPLTVFLSHAKADGVEIATAIRGALADFSQLKAWFDANDLPAGYQWSPRIIDAAENNTAALVSVVTDVYSSRHWCRLEVNHARMPRPLALDAPIRGVTAWTVQPAVAVAHSGNKWCRPMAQLAQVPRLGWTDRIGATQVEDVIDRLLLETLIVTFYRKLAPMIAQRFDGLPAARRGDEHLAVLTWVPDPWSITHLVDLVGPEVGDGRCIIAYPGCGLRAGELGELSGVLRVLGRLSGDPDKYELISHERLEQVRMVEIPDGIQVGISGSGGDADVRLAGIGARHVGDFVVRLSRRLLEAGARLHYGGALSDYKNNITQALIDVAQGWTNLESQKEDEANGRPRQRPSPLVNYAAWPFHRFIALAQRAELTGICDFVHVDPDVPDLPPATSYAGENPEHARWTADALTLMRKQSGEATEIRIVFGGKKHGWMGWLPGILEEVVCTLEAKKLPLVLGGFGGNAGEVADFLLDEQARWEDALGFEHARKNPALSVLFRADGAEETARAQNESAREVLGRFRAQLHGSSEWPFGEVRREDVLELLRLQSPAAIIDRILGLLPTLRT